MKTLADRVEIIDRSRRQIHYGDIGKRYLRGCRRGYEDISRPRQDVCMYVWSRETGSTVPSRVSPLVFHIQAEPSAYSRAAPLSFLPLFATKVYGVNLYRQPPSAQSRVFNYVTQYAPMAFTVESPAQGQ